jgi:hypothetical protein
LTAAITGLESDHAGTAIPAAEKPAPFGEGLLTAAEVGLRRTRAGAGQHDHPH